MIRTCPDVQTLVTRVQDAFLDVPALHLTLPQAQQRFGVDAATCAAILGTLVEAGVLERTPNQEYSRHFPHAA
jgi:DNA-binding IclR family transcriptional regulator